MGRADLIINIVEYGLNGDKAKLKKATEAVIAEERSKQHNILAKKLETILQSTFSENATNRNFVENFRTSNFYYEITPQKKLSDLILSDQIKQIYNEIIEEQFRCDLLRSYNIEPRNRILLIGPPGNGKTSLAEAIAESLMVPLIIVKYENIIGTYLGETAARLRTLMNFACSRKCVLFFDEFETLGKERGDLQETGEIKRVVSSLLLQIDDLPSHVVIIGATNHPELLDRAVWRRFQVRIEIPSPTKLQLIEWFERFEKKLKTPLGVSFEVLAKKMEGSNFSEVEEFSKTVFRQFILGQPEIKIKDVIQRTLKNWEIYTAKIDQNKNGVK